MIALIQRVSSASVTVNNEIIGEISQGLLVFLAIEPEDNEAKAKRLSERVAGYRVFEDSQGKMNLNVQQVNGEILIISNATLFGQETKDIDLIAIGKFEKYRQRVKTKHKSYGENKNIVHDQEMRTIFINDFCFVFETKRHRATDVRLDGLTLSVTYKSKHSSKRSDVTTQSEKGKRFQHQKKNIAALLVCPNCQSLLGTHLR